MITVTLDEFQILLRYGILSVLVTDSQPLVKGGPVEVRTTTSGSNYALLYCRVAGITGSAPARQVEMYRR